MIREKDIEGAIFQVDPFQVLFSQIEFRKNTPKRVSAKFWAVLGVFWRHFSLRKE
jgi:hypothetical protein